MTKLLRQKIVEVSDKCCSVNNVITSSKRSDRLPFLFSQRQSTENNHIRDIVDTFFISVIDY